MELWDILQTVVVPAVTWLAGWLTGGKRRRNDFLKEMQSSIDLLTRENARLVSENMELRREMLELKLKLHEMQLKNNENNENDGNGTARRNGGAPRPPRVLRG